MPADGEGKRHRRIKVRARNMTERVDHRRYDQAEDHRDHYWREMSGICHDNTATAEEHDGKRAKAFGDTPAEKIIAPQFVLRNYEHTMIQYLL